MKVCKEFNPQCLLIARCTETCDEFKKYIYNNAYNYIRRVQACCICGNDIVEYYANNTSSTYIDDLPVVSLYMRCEDCKGVIVLTFKNRANPLNVSCDYIKTEDEIKRNEIFPQIPTFFNFYSEVGTIEDAINHAIKRARDIEELKE